MKIENLRIMNAAGWCKEIEAVQKLANAAVTEITVGSITMERRAGNSGTTFWQSPDGGYSLNSLGLPNRGSEHYLDVLSPMRNIADAADKRLRLSIAGFNPGEYAHLTWKFATIVDTLEINLGCPNIWGKDGQKPIAAFNAGLMASILNAVGEALQDTGAHPEIAVKLSPYSDPSMIDKVGEVLKAEDELVREIVTCNTFPNAHGWQKDRPAITVGSGFAGLSGKALKAIAVGQVMQFREKLGDDVSIIGVGGITCGADIIDLLRAGADGVQIGTHYFLHGEKVFGELLTESMELF